RATKFQRIQQEAKLGTSLFLSDTQDTEHRFLHFLVVDTDRTTAKLGTIKHHVIGTGQGVRRVCCQVFRAAGRRCERVVDSSQIAIRQLFEHRSEEHTSELQSRENLVCRLLLEKKKK